MQGREGGANSSVVVCVMVDAISYQLLHFTELPQKANDIFCTFQDINVSDIYISILSASIEIRAVCVISYRYQCLGADLLAFAPNTPAFVGPAGCFYTSSTLQPRLRTHVIKCEPTLG